IQLAKAGTGPRLPGEPAPAWSAETFDIYGRPVDLPATPAKPQPNDSLQTQKAAAQKTAQVRKGVILSAIATLLLAGHYGLVGVLAEGGRWLGFSVGQIGISFVPAVGLLWLRMLVMVPALILLATQIHRRTWEDLQDWIYRRDRLLTVLIGSGIALFFSQVLLYQSIAQAGPVLGVTLLFLYPLLVVPLKLLTRHWRLSSLGGVALVAIAMGGFLTIRPTVRPAIGTATPTAIWLGLLASVAFSLYLVLTNVSYQQQCHPIPVGIVQFSTVAVLSSIVLIVKPLELANIGLFSFALWGILLGTVMLLIYLFDYSSLRLGGASAAAMTAITPLATVALAWSFSSPDSLEIIQWTGILLLSIGGVALSQEKLSKP
ncbi:MAG: DMT family transporter, partial [Phormidesmis sp.]